MRFRFDDEQLAMRDAARRLAAGPAGWAALADLGVPGLLAGGPKAPVGLVEAALVFEELGAGLVPGPVLWSTLAAPFVAGVAEGEVRVAGIEVDATTAAAPVVVDHGGECDMM